MRYWFLLILGIIASSLPSVAGAQEVYVSKEQQKQLFDAVQDAPGLEVASVINLYSNVLNYSYPKRLVPAYQAITPSTFMLEFIPFGENVQADWTEMFTIQAFPGRSFGSTTAKDLAALVGQKVGESCPESKFFEDLGEVPIADASSHRVIFGCRNHSVVGNGEVGEMTIAQTIKRNDDFIMVQFSRRGEPKANGQPLIDNDQKEYYLSLLTQLIVSDNLSAKPR